jgi:hypothetical protein
MKMVSPARPLAQLGSERLAEVVRAYGEELRTLAERHAYFLRLSSLRERSEGSRHDHVCRPRR